MTMRLRAALTVEAAILIPFYMMLVSLGVKTAVDLYQDVRMEAESLAPSSEYESVKLFRLTEAGEKLLFGK